ncbi:hypothetical protein I4U23_027030 [Adineta vaga]|nr:hypothetical protein I4U23_027030 [Adineta vaga]
MKSTLIYLSLCLFCVHYLQGHLIKHSVVDFGDENWALGCDYVGRNYKQISVQRDECREKCDEESECTHYTWRSWNDGTCWLKNGSITKEEFVVSDDPNMLCGIKESTNEAVSGKIVEPEREDGEKIGELISD